MVDASLTTAVQSLTWPGKLDGTLGKAAHAVVAVGIQPRRCV